jgi:hypothetical protein
MPVVVGLALTPWLALLIATRSPRSYVVGRMRGNLWVAGLLPALALGALGGDDAVAVLLDWTALLVVALIAGAAIAALTGVALRTLLPATPGLRAGSLLLMFCCMSLYAYGGLALANSRLDPTPPERFRVAVLGGRVTHGRRSTHWMLRLAPWGPRTEPSESRVQSTVYRAVDVGDSVCIDLRPGALGIAWYAVLRCRDTGLE